MTTEQHYIAQLIIKLLKGELVDTQEKRDLEAWLAANDRHQNFIQELKSYHHLEEDMALLDSFDEQEAWQQIRDLRSTSVKKGTKYYFTRIAVAVVALFAVGALVYQLDYWEQSPSQGDRIVKDETGKYNNDVLPADNMAKLILADGSTVSVEHNNVLVQDGAIHLRDSEDHIYNEENESEPIYHTLVVPRASFFQIVLADGTKVWLNAMSQLHFPSRFTGDERRVILEGEGYFEVAKDNEKPFYVESGGALIRVLGTHFNVNSYKRAVKTTLVEGSVEIQSGEQRQLLQPGQEAESDTQRIKVRPVDTDKTIAWKNGEFQFKGDNIAYIASQLGSWYDLDIRFRGQLAMEKRYSGQISRDSKLSEVLEMLEYVSDLAFEIQGKELIIREKR